MNKIKAIEFRLEHPTCIFNEDLQQVFAFLQLKYMKLSDLPQGFLTGLAMAGKLFVAASFCMVYLYAGELYPTVVRSNGVGLCSMCARVGSMGSPQVKLLVSYLIFPLYIKCLPCEIILRALKSFEDPKCENVKILLLASYK